MFISHTSAYSKMFLHYLEKKTRFVAQMKREDKLLRQFAVSSEFRTRLQIHHAYLWFTQKGLLETDGV